MHFIYLSSFTLLVNFLDQLVKIQNDAEIDNYSLVYVPVLPHLVNSQFHSY